MGFSLELMTEPEREEGEIVEVIEYEDISSDEEINLRQRIEELEARNQELEQIASISSSKACDYGYGHHQQSNSTQIVDEISDDEIVYMGIPSHRKHGRSARKSDRTARRRKESSRSNRRRERSARHSKRTHRNNTKARTIQNSSSDEDAFQLNRDELRAALLTPAQSHKSSSLQRKLRGIQDTVTEFIDINSCGEHEADEVSASIEILELVETLTAENAVRSSATDVMEIIRVSDDSTAENETISLEEKELRLIALKSAILKKHEARKQRKAIEARPYSPTDVEIIYDTPTSTFLNGAHESQSAKTMRNEPENMDISPAISPALPDKTLQQVDMDLASDNDESSSAMDASAADTYNGWRPIPLPASPSSSRSNDHNNFNLFQPSTLIPPPPPPPPPPPFIDFTQPPPSVVVNKTISEAPLQPTNTITTDPLAFANDDSMEDDEDALRALLLAKAAKPKVPKQTKSTVATVRIAPPSASETMADSTMEADELRTFLLQSLVNKSRLKEQKENREKPSVSLKAAVERFKSTRTIVRNIPKPEAKAQPKTKASVVMKQTTAKTKTLSSSEPVQPSGKPKVAVTIPLGIQSTTDNVPAKSTSVVVPSKAKQLPVASKQITGNHDEVSKPVVVAAATLKRKLVDSTALESVKRPKPNPARSKVITNPNPKQIQKFIIRLNESDSNTDEEMDFTNLLVARPTDADRFFDNASPASIAMDSPIRSPASPMPTNTESAATNDIALPLAFEQKLDMFLKSVRSKEDVKKTIKASQRTTQGRPVVQRKKSEVPTTPLVVRHLPESAQDEYRRLINRMNLLEKKRATAKKLNKAPASDINPTHSVKNTTAQERPQLLAVVVPNNIAQPQAKRIVVLPPQQTKATEATPPKVKSLVKELLVKNVTLKLNPHTQQQPQPKPNVPDATSSAQPPKNSTKVVAIPKAVNKPKLTVKATRSLLENTKTSKVSQPAKPSIVVQPAKSAVIRNAECTAANLSPQITLLGMSATAKAELLKTHEIEYTKHSNEFLCEMTEMHRSVCAAQQSKRKQFALELQLDRLRAQVAQVEAALVDEKTTIAQLYPNISASRQNILKGRKKSIELSFTCQRLGVAICGPSYRTPADIRGHIVERLKDISCATKILKSLRKDSFDATTLPPLSSTATTMECGCQTDHGDDVPVKLPITKSSPCAQVVAGIEGNDAIDDCPSDDVKTMPTVSVSVASISIHPFETNQAADTCEKQIDVTAAEADADDARSQDDDCTALKKYQSPLEHMHRQSSGNPDAVICPFQLMGQCEDKECSYHHF